jgi:hypothetical protein
MPSISVPGLTGLSYDSAVVNFEQGYLWAYGSPYTWSVDSVNQFGTTVGDNWTFTSVVYDPPVSNWENLTGKTLGPLTNGVEGTDYRWLGNNIINTVKFFLVAKDSSIYYSEIY